MSKELSQALEALTGTSRYGGLEAAKARGAKSAQKSSARESGTLGSGGGIASPLTEEDATTRTYHAETTISTTDGLFQIKIKPIESITFHDAVGSPVQLFFDAP